MRIDGNGNMIQVIAFINKALSYSIMNPKLGMDEIWTIIDLY